MQPHQPTKNQLRLFGTLLAVVIVFWLCVYGWNKPTSLLTLWPGYSIAAILAAVAIIYPPWLKGVYHYWLKAAHYLNKIITTITLSLTFFIVITPVALVKRAFGNDALFGTKTTPKTMTNSYRQTSEPIKPEDMEHPF